MRSWVLAILLAAFCGVARADSERIPWLWDGAAQPAWSRGPVAVLIQHVLLAGGAVRTRSRMETPMLRSGTPVTPVVHVQVSTVDPPQLGSEAHAAILAAMQRAASLSTSGWVQLDMEARPSQRTFYVELVRDIRAALPPSTRLSVTALAWWCGSRAWLDSLAADEIVPMLFRLGTRNEEVRSLWTQAPERLHVRCRGPALGIAAQEPLPAEMLARYSRLYVFDRHGWRREEEQK